MVVLFVINSLADSSLQNWNRIGRVFLGDFFRSLGHRQRLCVAPQALSMVEWDSGSGRRPSTLKTTVFFAFAMSLCTSLVTKSKKRPVAWRFPTVSMDGSTRVANGNSSNGKS